MTHLVYFFLFFLPLLSFEEIKEVVKQTYCKSESGDLEHQLHTLTDS